MKKNLILFVCMATALHSFAQSDVANAKYLHVTVDGNNTEWGPLSFYDDYTQLNFGIANDTGNIYLCFATATQPAQMKLMRAGMKITLSTKGKPKHEASVLFPLAQAKQQPLPDSSIDKNNVPETQTVFNKETFRQNYIAHHSTMQVSGFANANGEISTNNPAIHAAVNWDSSSNMVYEIAIAKKEFFGNDYAAKDALSDITLNVELNGLSRAETGDAKDVEGVPHSDGIHAGMDGVGRHGKSMRGVGFNNGEMPQGNNASNENTNALNMKTFLNQKTSFRQKFVLNDSSTN